MSIELKNQIEELKRRVADLEHSRPTFAELALLMRRVEELEKHVSKKKNG